jgi:hypothetical protein
MSASKSTSAWNRQNSALNSLNQFAQACNQPLVWPLTSTCLRSYVAWALNTKKLSVATTRLYLSDLKNAHKLKNLCTSNFSDFYCLSMLKGAQNLSMYNGIINHSKLAMTFPLLKILGHEIAVCNWPTNSKRVVWAASCVAFFGSFRMGELLANKEHCVETETLTWDCEILHRNPQQ